MLLVPPALIENTNAANSLEGANATFICHVQSEPVHTTKWYFNENLLRNDGKYSITGEGTAYSTLTIVNVSFEDTGEYTCNASNEYGKINATGTLTVQGYN